MDAKHRLFKPGQTVVDLVRRPAISAAKLKLTESRDTRPAAGHRYVVPLTDPGLIPNSIRLRKSGPGRMEG
jgi:hypothetical protein